MEPFTREQLRLVLGKTLDVAALKRENRRLREVVAERFSFDNMIAASRTVRVTGPAQATEANTPAGHCGMRP